MAENSYPDRARRAPGLVICEHRNLLRIVLLNAIHELVEIQKQQAQAVIDGDPDFARFDILLHMARERKDSSKYEYIAHVESHQCEET